MRGIEESIDNPFEEFFVKRSKKEVVAGGFVELREGWLVGFRMRSNSMLMRMVH